MVAKRPPAQAVDVGAIFPLLCEHVRTHGAAKWTELSRLGVTKPLREAAATQLLKAGFEVTPRLVRIPLAEQIQSALAQRGQLPLKGMQNILAGCAAKELPLVVERLVHRGAAVKILRTKAQWLAPLDADVLTADELRALHRCVTEWSKQTHQAMAAGKDHLSIWRPDVRALLEVLGTFEQSESKTEPSGAEVRQLLRKVIKEQVNPTVGLAFVPKVVQSLQLPVAQVQRLLVEEARQGHLELRPDSGTARFTDAELAVAPCGPDGSRLLWIRLPEATA
jgi:hypothetical protein